MQRDVHAWHTPRPWFQSSQTWLEKHLNLRTLIWQLLTHELSHSASQCSFRFFQIAGIQSPSTLNLPLPSNFIKFEAGWHERQMITICSPDWTPLTFLPQMSLWKAPSNIKLFLFLPSEGLRGPVHIASSGLQRQTGSRSIRTWKTQERCNRNY